MDCQPMIYACIRKRENEFAKLATQLKISGDWCKQGSGWVRLGGSQCEIARTEMCGI